MKPGKIQRLAIEIENILKKVHSDQIEYKSLIKEIDQNHRKSATNLINYLSMRSFDLRDLQRRLGYLGMSRLARAEAHTEASIKTTLYYLKMLLGEWHPIPNKYTISIKKSEKLLIKNTYNLLGKPRATRRQRIMVTMPGVAADNIDLVKQMVLSGMDIARINCAHDTPDIWLKIIENIKECDEKTGSNTSIAMDIGGPKIRTGELEKPFKIQQDELLILHKQPIKGHKATYNENSNSIVPAEVSCTLPEVFDYIQEGDPVYFDDGSTDGIIETIADEKAIIRITRTKDEGSKIKPDKGINFPKSNLNIHGLTNTDKEHLKFISQYADIVNFSFVNTPEDVSELHDSLRQLGVLDSLGIIYKIETRQAYVNMAPILLEALKAPKSGVMIARGDLAIEAGWNHIAHIQKEMLALCNAAHIPIVWATQVLENLAKKGLPSRSEITDAANAAKAECIMLNKGPHIIEAIRLLDEIIEDTEPYQDKNAPMLPPLHLLKNS
jgi:pyruvate kinase